MKRYQICMTVINMILSCTLHLTNSNTWKLFEKIKNVEKQICMDSDSVFSKIQIFDKSACLHQCVSHSGCKSVFHGQNTGDCIGCVARFDISNQPVETKNNLEYYWQPSCPDGWSDFVNSCYLITDKRMNFQTGVATCESLNARAVIIESEQENNFLKTLINSTFDHTGDDTAFFTGFTDMYNEGTWVEYGTSNQMTFQDWDHEEPNVIQEDCLALYFPADLKWVDIYCSQVKRMICERN